MSTSGLEPLNCYLSPDMLRCHASLSACLSDRCLKPVMSKDEVPVFQTSSFHVLLHLRKPHPSPSCSSGRNAGDSPWFLPPNCPCSWLRLCTYTQAPRGHMGLRGPNQRVCSLHPTLSAPQLSTEIWVTWCQNCTPPGGPHLPVPSPPLPPSTPAPPSPWPCPDPAFRLLLGLLAGHSNCVCIFGVTFLSSCFNVCHL